MKISIFHLMPYSFLPETFEKECRSVRVDPPSSLYDAGKAHGLHLESADAVAAAAGRFFS